MSKRRHDLIEIVAPGPGAAKQARRVRDRLISQVEERRNPRTKATVDQLLERYLDQFDGAASTLTLYRGYVRNHISPFLGKIKVGVRWMRTRWTRFTRSCAGAGTTARGARSSSTAPPSSIVVTSAAVSIAAGRWVRRPSGTCTSSSRGPTSAPCAGSGSRTARCARPSLQLRPCRIRTHRVQLKQPGSSTRRGRIPTGHVRLAGDDHGSAPRNYAPCAGREST